MLRTHSHPDIRLCLTSLYPVRAPTLPWEPVWPEAFWDCLFLLRLPRMNPAALSNVHSNGLPGVRTHVVPKDCYQSLVCHQASGPQLVPCRPYIYSVQPNYIRSSKINTEHFRSRLECWKTVRHEALFVVSREERKREEGRLPALPLRLAADEWHQLLPPASDICCSIYSQRVAWISYKNAQKQCFSGAGLMGPATTVNCWIYEFTLAGGLFPRHSFPWTISIGQTLCFGWATEGLYYFAVSDYSRTHLKIAASNLLAWN